MKVYAIDYVVGNTYKVKRIKAETVEQAIKKARLGKSIVDINIEEETTIMQYKKAESQGAYIDRLRVKYPFCICRKSEPEYRAVLKGVQPLLEGQEVPIYRFPGGECCQDPFENGIEIIEW